jgi:hypothetical protein
MDHMKEGTLVAEVQDDVQEFRPNEEVHRR